MGDENVVLFLVEKQQNLPGFIEEGALDKVVVVAKWADMLPFLESLEAQDEDEEIRVILRITIPLDEFADLKFYKCVGDPRDKKGDSWYFEGTVDISYVEIAINDDQNAVWEGQPWIFKPLAEYDDHIVPDLPIPDVSDEFDMSEEFMEANKSLFEVLDPDDDWWTIFTEFLICAF